MSNQLLNDKLCEYIIQIAQKPNAKEQLRLFLDTLLCATQQEKQEENFYEKPASSLVVFTKKELSEMPQKIGKLFKMGKIRAMSFAVKTDCVSFDVKSIKCESASPQANSTTVKNNSLKNCTKSWNLSHSTAKPKAKRDLRPSFRIWKRGWKTLKNLLSKRALTLITHV